MGRKNVDKKIDKHNKQDLGIQVHENETDNYSRWDACKLSIFCFCYYRLFLSIFLIPGWKCATMSTWCCPHGMQWWNWLNWHSSRRQLVRFCWTISILNILCSPNEGFGRIDKRWNPGSRYTFQWFVAQIEYSHPWDVYRKSWFHLLSILPKSSFGRDTFRQIFQGGFVVDTFV